MNLGGIAATAVGAVFVYAGCTKLLAGRRWPESARRLGVPGWVALVVTPVEVVVGLGMVLGDQWRRGFLAVAGAMLVAFTVFLARKLRDDDRPPCACFGASSTRPIGARDVVRNISLLILVIVAIAS